MPVFTSTRLLNRLHEHIRYPHYSLRAKEAYLYCGRDFLFGGMDATARCAIHVVWVPQRFHSKPKNSNFDSCSRTFYKAFAQVMLVPDAQTKA